jgi:hypothetical protein
VQNIDDQDSTAVSRSVLGCLCCIFDDDSTIQTVKCYVRDWSHANWRVILECLWFFWGQYQFGDMSREMSNGDGMKEKCCEMKLQYKLKGQ